MYAFLDNFFVVFHGSLVLFILIGLDLAADPAHSFAGDFSDVFIVVWIRPLLRNWILVPPLTGTGASRKRAQTDLPNSYVKYYLDRLTGLSWDPILVGSIVMLIGLIALVVSLALNWRDWHRSLTFQRQMRGHSGTPFWTLNFDKSQPI
jgi:hypothetical protein